MLNDIDEHYQSLNYTQEQFSIVWKQLSQKVKFWILYLSDLNTTDELYIKMNSRGKPLTDFEHFKAMLEEYAQTGGVLSNKIDTEWTKLLWRYRDSSKDLGESYADNGLDKCFYNLLLFYLNIEGCKRGLTDYDHPETDILVLANKVLSYKKTKELTPEEERSKRNEKINEVKEIMNRFTNILDFFSERDADGKYINDPKHFFSNYIQPDYTKWTVSSTDMANPETVKVFIGEVPEERIDLLKQICSYGKLENKTTLYAEAFFQYAASNPSKRVSEKFLDRLRLLRNLVENTEIHARSFRDNLLLTDEIIANGNLSKDGISDEFNKAQKRQEGIKQKWMENRPQYVSLLKMLENHRLLMGNLNVCIEKDTNNTETINLEALEKFGHLFHFNCDYEKIQLALLTLKDYSPLPSNNKIRFYGGNDWKRWRDLTQSYNQITPGVVQEFLKTYNKYDSDGLNKIIEDYLNKERSTYDWPYYLVKYEEMRRSARYAKYRYLQGHYSHMMLNANGGGGPEKYWNPYNSALGEKIKDTIPNTVDCYGKELTLTEKNIKVDIREHDIEITCLDGSIRKEIPHDPETGLDTSDRIEYASDIIKNYIAQRNAINMDS